MNQPTANPGHHTPQSRLLPMVIGATGAVFGDIGTSPLYTMKTVLKLAGGRVDAVSVPVATADIAALRCPRRPTR